MAGWRGITADLAAYIEQQAAVLATPMIQMAIADADQRIGVAVGELQRRDDVLAELRRRLEAMERQLRQWQTATGHRTVAAYQTAAWSDIGPDAGGGRLRVAPAGTADNLEPPERDGG